jgi:hypothetical protein
MRQGAVLVARATSEGVELREQGKVYSNDSLITYVPSAKVIKNLDKIRRRFIHDEIHDMYKSECRRKQLSHDRKKSMMPFFPHKLLAVLADRIFSRCVEITPGIVREDDKYPSTLIVIYNEIVYEVSDSLTNIVRQMDLNDIKNIKLCNNIVSIENSFLMHTKTVLQTKNV